MQVNYKLVKDFSFSAVLAVGLIACGGGSGSKTGGNSNNSGNNGSGGDNASGVGSTGSGGCVSYPRPVVGQIVKREIKDADGNITTTKQTTITAITNSTITQEIASEFSVLELKFNSTITDHFTIANNYMDITKQVSTSGTTTYKPFQRIPIDEVCEGQTWNSTYTATDFGSVRQISRTSTIEAVNVSITTALGTFNTIRISSVETNDNTSIEGTTWIDINTGYDVLSKFGDTNGNLRGSLELVKKNF